MKASEGWAVEIEYHNETLIQSSSAQYHKEKGRTKS